MPATTKRKAVRSRPSQVPSPLPKPPYGYDSDGRPMSPLRKAQHVVYDAMRAIGNAYQDVGMGGTREALFPGGSAKSHHYRLMRLQIETAEAWRKINRALIDLRGLGPDGNWLLEESRALVAAMYRAALATEVAADRIKAEGMESADVYNTIGCLRNTLADVVARYTPKSDALDANYAPQPQ